MCDMIPIVQRWYLLGVVIVPIKPLKINYAMRDCIITIDCVYRLK